MFLYERRKLLRIENENNSYLEAYNRYARPQKFSNRDTTSTELFNKNHMFTCYWESLGLFLEIDTHEFQHPLDDNISNYVKQIIMDDIEEEEYMITVNLSSGVYNNYLNYDYYEKQFNKYLFYTCYSDGNDNMKDQNIDMDVLTNDNRFDFDVGENIVPEISEFIENNSLECKLFIDKIMGLDGIIEDDSICHRGLERYTSSKIFYYLYTDIYDSVQINVEHNFGSNNDIIGNLAINWHYHDIEVIKVAMKQLSSTNTIIKIANVNG